MRGSVCGPGENGSCYRRAPTRVREADAARLNRASERRTTRTRREHKTAPGSPGLIWVSGRASTPLLE